MQCKQNKSQIVHFIKVQMLLVLYFFIGLWKVWNGLIFLPVCCFHHHSWEQKLLKVLWLQALNVTRTPGTVHGCRAWVVNSMLQLFVMSSAFSPIHNLWFTLGHVDSKHWISIRHIELVEDIWQLNKQLWVCPGSWEHDNIWRDSMWISHHSLYLTNTGLKSCIIIGYFFCIAPY